MSHVEPNQERAAKGPAKGPCNCGCGGCADQKAKEDARNARRKFLVGGVVATPALLVLKSRPAVGLDFCTISGMQSGNLSGQQQKTCQGISTGCWKNTTSWPAPFVAGPCNPTNTNNNCTDYSFVARETYKDWYVNKNKKNNSTPQELQQLAQQAYAYWDTTYYPAYLNASKCSGIFSFPVSPSDLTMMQAMWTYPGSLLFHAVGAVLGAAYLGKNVYGYSVSEILSVINARYNDSTLASDLQALNDRVGPVGCPHN